MNYLLQYSYLLPSAIFLVVLIYKKKNATKEILFVAIYGLIFFALLRLFSLIPFEYKKLYSSIFTFLEYLFFTSFIYFHIVSLKLRKVIIFVSISFIAFQVIFYLSSEFSRLDSLSIAIETILLSIFIILFFYEQFKNQKSEFIYTHPAFWLALGILVYLCGTFFFNILVEHLTVAEIEKYEPLTYIGDILKNISFTIALILLSRRAKERHFHHSSVPFLDLDMN